MANKGRNERMHEITKCLESQLNDVVPKNKPVPTELEITLLVHQPPCSCPAHTYNYSYGQTHAQCNAYIHTPLILCKACFSKSMQEKITRKINTFAIYIYTLFSHKNILLLS